MILISEAQHGLRSNLVAAIGEWPPQVQLDGRKLQKVFETLPSESQVELIALKDDLVILAGRAQIVMPRLEPGDEGGIKSWPIPRNPKHKGKVEVPPDPVGKRLELADTWLFSARVPMPQHRDPETNEADEH
jgi:hypothetical protein